MEEHDAGRAEQAHSPTCHVSSQYCPPPPYTFRIFRPSFRFGFGSGMVHLSCCIHLPNCRVQGQSLANGTPG